MLSQAPVFLPFPGCGLRLTFRRIVGGGDWSNIVLHFGSGVRIFCRFLLCGGGAWLCPRRLWMRLLAFFRLRENQDEVQLVEEVEAIRADQKATWFVAAHC